MHSSWMTITAIAALAMGNAASAEEGDATTAGRWSGSVTLRATGADAADSVTLAAGSRIDVSDMEGPYTVSSAWLGPPGLEPGRRSRGSGF